MEILNRYNIRKHASLPMYGRQRVTLGLKGNELLGVMEEWLHRGAPVSLTVRRARTTGLMLCVMEVDYAHEPAGALFASWALQHGAGGVRVPHVDIKDLK